MLPNQFRFECCLWEAWGGAGAVLSWLGMEEDKGRLHRGVGRLFRICRRGNR